jgi:hypothetical protein
VIRAAGHTAALRRFDGRDESEGGCRDRHGDDRADRHDGDVPKAAAPFAGGYRARPEYRAKPAPLLMREAARGKFRARLLRLAPGHLR